jgi:hypothetical protein
MAVRSVANSTIECGVLSQRSRLSLAQLLRTELRVLFDKYGLLPFDNLASTLGGAGETVCIRILEEVGLTYAMMRRNVAPTYIWDLRFGDLDRLFDVRWLPVWPTRMEPALTAPH